MKYLGINLTKLIQDLYDEKYKMLMKEVKDLNACREIPCSWIRGISIVEMSIVLKLPVGLTRVLSKSP